LNIAEQFLAQRRQAQTPRGVGSGILLLQANGDGIQIGARLFRKLSATVHGCSRKPCTVAESLQSRN